MIESLRVRFESSGRCETGIRAKGWSVSLLAGPLPERSQTDVMRFRGSDAEVSTIVSATSPEVAPLSPGDPRADDPLLTDLVQFVGYRPNALLTMARRQGLLGAVLNLVQVALRGEASLAQDLRFLLACEASRCAGCFYSATHAVHAAHHLGIPWAKLTELDRYASSEWFTPAERAALAIASAGGPLPVAPSGAAYEAARQYFDDEQLVEITAAIALFGWFNRWNSLMGSELEEVPAEALAQVEWLSTMSSAAKGEADAS